MSGVVIAPCVCKHPYQDKKYGTGLRVHNLGKKTKNCTVCGKEKV